MIRCPDLVFSDVFSSDGGGRFEVSAVEVGAPFDKEVLFFKSVMVRDESAYKQLERRRMFLTGSN